MEFLHQLGNFLFKKIKISAGLVIGTVLNLQINLALIEIFIIFSLQTMNKTYLLVYLGSSLFSHQCFIILSLQVFHIFKYLGRTWQKMWKTCKLKMIKHWWENIIKISIFDGIINGIVFIKFLIVYFLYFHLVFCNLVKFKV